MTLSIHHATAKKAEKAGVTLTVEGDRIVAIDTQNNPDSEYQGTNAKELLERVLNLRPGNDADEDGEDTDDGDEGEVEDAGDPADDDAEGEVEAAEGDEEEPEAGGSIVKPKYRVAYEVFDGTCGDEFANAFSLACRNGEGEFDVDALRSVASANGIDLDARWGHVNVGQQRMNLSNVLRGKVRRGEVVNIAATRFEPVVDAEGKPTGASKKVVKRGAAM